MVGLDRAWRCAPSAGTWWRSAAASSSEDVQPARPPASSADLSTIETLVEELGHPDPRHVLLRHRAARVARQAAPGLAAAAPPRVARGPRPGARARSKRPGRRSGDGGPPASSRCSRTTTRACAPRRCGALAAIRGEEAFGLMRPYLEDRDPRIVVTAAVALAASPARPIGRGRSHAAAARRRHRGEPAAERGARWRRRSARSRHPRFRHLLMPLMYDPAHDVAAEAIRSAGRLGASDYLFVPPLLSLLRNRLLKRAAREVLVGYGAGHRRHARLLHAGSRGGRRGCDGTSRPRWRGFPTQKSVDVLVAALEDPDGFLRLQGDARRSSACGATDPALTVPAEPIIEALARGGEPLLQLPEPPLQPRGPRPGRQGHAARAGAQREAAADGRSHLPAARRCIYPWKDIAAARWTLEHGDGRAPRRRARVPRQPADGRRAQAGAAGARGGAARREGAPRQPAAQVARRATPRTASRSSSTTRTRSSPPTAIHFVETRSLWSLADDLEYALEHRDARDWYVFEAASWALAARRMAADGAARALDGAAAGRRARRPPAPHVALRLRVGRRAVPHRGGRAPGAPRARAACCSSRARAPTTCSSCSTARSAVRADDGAAEPR